jgi:hypothetical protein
LTLGITFDYWKNASCSDWRNHVIQSLELSRDLITDWDHTCFEATKVLSDAYISLHGHRVRENPEPNDEHELEDIFWHLQRSSTVIDSVVGSACVVLMRWMDQAKQIAIGSFILIETKFPFEADSEPQNAKWNRHHRSVMEDFGSSVHGKKVGTALAVWQIGNAFKHGAGGELHDRTKRVMEELGFSSQLLGTPEHEGEERLREMALKEVAYTLGSDSIERMALQLGCGPNQGLMPLYGHVESWQKDIDKRLSDAQAALRGLA